MCCRAASRDGPCPDCFGMQRAVGWVPSGARNPTNLLDDYRESIMSKPQGFRPELSARSGDLAPHLSYMKTWPWLRLDHAAVETNKQCLFYKRHFTNRGLSIALKIVEINSGGYGITVLIFPIPNNAMPSRSKLPVN